MIMLKRNGEDCEHAVPNYPGLLTANELRIYKAVLPIVVEQVRQFNERAAMLLEIEVKTLKIAEEVAARPVQPVGFWHVRYNLSKTLQSQLVLCSKGINGKERFGIIEQFDPDSPYAQANGNTALRMAGSDVAFLLRNYVENERAELRLFRADIEATVKESLAKEFPGLDCSRIVSAISSLCGVKASAKNEESPAQQQVGNMQIRF
jgi:hypothetical protein